MSDKNYGLELYKLLTCPDEGDPDMQYADEMGWIDDKSFCVWVDYLWFDDFIEGLKRIFGYSLFEGAGIDAKLQSDWVCIDLREAVGGYLNLEDVFPKDKYQH